MGEKNMQTVVGESDVTFINAKKLFEEGKINEIIASGVYQGPVDNPRFGGQDFKVLGEDGKTIILNKAGNLSYLLGSIEEGTYIEVTYLGKSELTSGNFKGTMAHNFRVDREVVEV